MAPRARTETPALLEVEVRSLPAGAASRSHSGRRAVRFGEPPRDLEKPPSKPEFVAEDRALDVRGSNELVGLAFEGVRGFARGGRYNRHLLLRLRSSRRRLNWVWSVAGRLGFSSGAVEMQDR